MQEAKGGGRTLRTEVSDLESILTNYTKRSRIKLSRSEKSKKRCKAVKRNKEKINKHWVPASDRGDGVSVAQIDTCLRGFWLL